MSVLHDFMRLIMVDMIVSALAEQCNLKQHILLLGLSTKYGATQLLRRITTVLDHFFSNTLLGHDHYWKHCDSSPECSIVARHPGLVADGVTEKSMALMFQVAQQSGVLIYLPSIFLHVVEGVPEQIIHRYTFLSNNDLVTIFNGRQQLWRMARQGVTDALFSSPGHISACCVHPDACHRARLVIMGTIEADADRLASPFNRLKPEDDGMSLLCQHCRRKVVLSYAKLRTLMWEQLPEQFGLPCWEELRAVRTGFFDGA